MKEFQKIALGLLGRSNPEMFIPTRQDGAMPPVAREPILGRGRVARLLRGLKFMFAALAIGSRTVPLADNSELLRDLTAHARLLYGADARCG